MSEHETLEVKLGERSYDIVVGSRLIEKAGGRMLEVLPSKKVFIVTDDNVAPLYLGKLQSSLRDAGITHNYFITKHGEQSKSFSNLEKLLDAIFETNPDRKTTLIALGGGVVGDLTGFAASIILRGINFIQIPTTLLAQVDSSVGGKTGINNKFGKNLIGAFHQPLLVLADTDTLATLPKREFAAGYAEVVKYGLIGDIKFFDWLNQEVNSCLENNENVLEELQKNITALKTIIKQSCGEKANIVSQDEREGGIRALLNLGHTFGHALEKAMGYSDKLLHGEAVSIGMVFAFKLSQKMGLCEQAEVIKVINHLKSAGLPTSPLEIKNNWGYVWNADDLMNSMRQDKKAFSGKMTFILVRGIGQSFIENNIPETIIRELVGEVLSGK
jgi:3-dehydroquinate synthase